MTSTTPPCTAEVVEREPAPQLSRETRARQQLERLYQSLEDPNSKLALRREHIEKLVTNVAAAEKPSEKILARWGTNNPILAYEKGTILVYEGFEKENIDREHAVVHEVAEALLDSGLFRGAEWKEAVERLDQSELEDTGYVRGIRQELRALQSDRSLLETKSGQAGMAPEVYLDWVQKRVHHEQFVENLAFYLRGGGNEEEMLRLRMEHVPAGSLPTGWQEALTSGNRTKVADLYKESGLEGRNRYFYQLFHGVLGERTPQNLTNELNNLQTQESADEEYEELLELEMLEAEMGMEAVIQEPPVMARPPKLHNEPSLWDLIKAVFSPKPEQRKPIIH